MIKYNKWYCLTDEGLLWALGEHDDFESADKTAEKMGLKAIWIIDPSGANSWRETLLEIEENENA